MRACSNVQSVTTTAIINGTTMTITRRRYSCVPIQRSHIHPRNSHDHTSLFRSRRIVALATCRALLHDVRYSPLTSTRRRSLTSLRRWPCHPCRLVAPAISMKRKRHHQASGCSSGRIYVAKSATIVIVIWAAHDYEATSLIAATTWPWLALAGALGCGPLAFHIRLRRVRAKRAQLHRAEWNIAPTPDPTAPKPIL